jgi:hypothetical protein
MDLGSGLHAVIGADSAERSVSNAAANIESTLSGVGSGSHGWGSDMLTNFNNGFVEGFDNVLVPNLKKAAQVMKDILGHSKPKEGPLRDDDVWLYHMAQNLADGLERGIPLIEGQAESIAENLVNTFDAGVLKDSGSKYVNAYRDVLGGIESLADSHDRRMSAYVGDYRSSVSVETSSAVRSVTDAITAAVGSLRAQSIPPVVVERMYVRDESDIRKVSRELNRLQRREERGALV